MNNYDSSSRHHGCIPVILAVILISFVIGCGRQSPNQPSNSRDDSANTKSPPAQPSRSDIQGREDGGGGFILQSSKDEVRDAINKAWKYAIYPNASVNPLQQFAEWYWNKYDRRQEKLTAIIDKIFDPAALRHLKTRNDPSRDADQGLMFYTRFWQYLRKSEKVILDNESCRGPNSPHSDGAVTHRKFGASVCFDIHGLREVPPYSLVNEVLGLLVHELVHLNGYGESEANAVQKLAAGFFGRIASGATAMEQRANIEDHFSNAKLLISNMLQERGLDPKAPKMAIDLGRMAHELRGIPSYKDPVEVEISLHLSESVNCMKFFGQVASVKSNLKELLSSQNPLQDSYDSDGFYLPGVPSEPVVQDPKRWAWSLETLKTTLKLIEEAEGLLLQCFEQTTVPQ